MSHDVFISYSSADKIVADAACATLEQHKIRCWMAPRDIVAGTSWSASIVNAIHDCKVMVLIFSANANQSDQIKREVERAVTKGVPILPFRIENVVPSADLEYFLSVPHWLDAMHPPLEDHLAALAETVKVLIEKKQPGAIPMTPRVPAAAPPRNRRKVLASIVGATGLLACVALVAGLLYFGKGPPRPTGTAVSKSVDMQFVLIEPGEFRMGVDHNPEVLVDAMPNVKDLNKDAMPAHQVKITRPYYLGVTEVTVKQFRMFVDASGYRTDAERNGNGHGFDPNGFMGAPSPIPNEKFTWKFTGLPQADDHPVVIVSWNDAVEFCAWLSKKEGVAHRLPTEAEWEYACRAGKKGFYTEGDHPRALEGYANLADAAHKLKFPIMEASKFAPWNDGFGVTAPVKSFKPNAWGLYDMHGNVGEWCSDWYDAEAYRGAEERIDPSGPQKGTWRVRRGSCWSDLPAWSLAANRWGPSQGYPLHQMPEYGSNELGFRVIRAAQ
jgi:formylglycine-generating enzyme required for sulfatase activity